jgi:hypothetical protein
MSVILKSDLVSLLPSPSRSLPQTRTRSKDASTGTPAAALSTLPDALNPCPQPLPTARRYSTSNSAYPGQLHSTGTEDEFLSSYYFDLGPFESKTAGLLYKSVPSYSGDPVATAMWRTYQVGPRNVVALSRSCSKR